MSQPSLVARRLLAHEWEVYRDLRLGALADSPDAFGATRSHEAGSIDWKLKLAESSSSKTDQPVIVEQDDTPIGLAWGKISSDSPDHAHIYQMWVSPQFRGRGAGTALLHNILEWARGHGVRSVFLRVTCGDTPARRLYERAGFVPVDAPEPIRSGANVLVQRMRCDLDRTTAR